MKTITFTYQLTPEKPSGFSVLCLDWENLIFTEGETINECKKNAIQLTEYFLKELIKNRLPKTENFKIKNHKLNPLQLHLSFDMKTGKYIDITKIRYSNKSVEFSQVAALR